MVEAARDFLLLEAETFGGEQRIDFGVRLVTKRGHEAFELGVTLGAAGAVGEMFGRWWIERLAATLGKIAIRQRIVLEVWRACAHGWPPRSARSLRAARNRWTRTVDSFRPIMALTSRGVQSP